MAIKPMKDKILVDLIKEELTMEGGLFLTVTKKDTVNVKVLTCGSAIVDVKPGDVVIIHENSGVTVVDGGKEFKILEQSDLIAIVE